MGLGVRWGTVWRVLPLIGIAIQQYVTTIQQRNLVERLANRHDHGQFAMVQSEDIIADLQRVPCRLVAERLKAAFDRAQFRPKVVIGICIGRLRPG